MTDEDFEFLDIDAIAKRHEEQLERAYKLGLLHGINTQAMARAELDVMEFSDYGWTLGADD